MDRDEFEQFYRDVAPGLFQFIQGMTRRGEVDAPEIVQEVMLAAFQKWTELEGRDRRPWIYRVARNKVIDQLRAPGRKTTSVPVEDLYDVVSTSPDPLNKLLAQEAVGRAAPLVQGLPQGQREVITRAIAGYGTDETAEQLDMSPRAVQTQLRRARNTLREQLNTRALLDEVESRLKDIPAQYRILAPPLDLQTAVLLASNSGLTDSQIAHQYPKFSNGLKYASIIESAASEFVKSGYDRASLTRILEGSRATKGTLYYHFESKEALAKAVMREANRRYREVVGRWHGRADFGPLDALHGMIDEIALRFERENILQATHLLRTEPWATAEDDDAGWGSLARGIRLLALRAISSNELDSDADADRFTRMLLAMLMGHCMTAGEHASCLRTRFEEALEVVVTSMATAEWRETFDRCGWRPHESIEKSA